MTTPSEVIGLIAPDAIRAILSPGATIATSYHDTHDWMDWNVVNFEDEGDDRYRFACTSSRPFRADCTVTLDRECRVAVHRATLTNTSSTRSNPMNDVAALCLQLENVTSPAIFSCSGAGNSSGWPHAREYPAEAFRPRWLAPLSPRPVFLQGGGTGNHQLVSSTRDLPLFMVRPDFASDDAPGLLIGME